jgi:cytochrome d ubiquinol oxidase subunit II
VTDLVGGVLFLGVILYAVFGGADFGAGFWDLTAGDAVRGRRPRALIDRAIGPVWEANHVWLIFCLVVTWTAFPGAFAPLMTTLWIPLALAAFGIVLRGSGFAFRKMVVRTSEQRAAGAVFALSSVITPFWFGTVAGGIASGRVPGRGTAPYLNPTSLLGGALAVVVCAYLAAVFLAAEARLRRADDLETWFRLRATVAATVAGALAVAGVGVLRADAPRLYHRLVGPGLPFLVLSVASGLAALLLLPRADPRLVRALAVTAVVAVLGGWAVGQYPYLLGTHLPLSAAAAPRPTLVSLTAIAAAAAVICGPALLLLYLLQERGRLEDESPPFRPEPAR